MRYCLSFVPCCRYLDIMRYGLKMQREVREVEMGEHGAVMRRTPKGEVHAVLQMVGGLVAPSWIGVEKHAYLFIRCVDNVRIARE